MIEELEIAEATKFKMVLLVVIFQDGGNGIHPKRSHNSARGALAVALARGGRAVGFIGLRDDGESLSFYPAQARLDSSRKEIFSEYLASLTDEIKRRFYQGDV